MEKFRQKKHKKNSIKSIAQKTKDEENNPKTKSLIAFDASLSCSVKCLAVKKNETIKPTTRFFNGKMLMFGKISLKSFVYEFTKTFFFPNQKTREIYQKYMIEQIFPYSVLTDTDSICIFFVLSCKPSCNIPNKTFCDVLFEVIIKNKILNGFDISHEFWDQFNGRNKDLRKNSGIFQLKTLMTHA